MKEGSNFKKTLLISAITGASLLMGSKNVMGQEKGGRSDYKTEVLDLDSVLENKKEQAEKTMQSYMSSLDLLYVITKDDTVKELQTFLKDRLVPLGSKDFNNDQQIYFIPLYDGDHDIPGVAMAFEKSNEKLKNLHKKIHPGAYPLIEDFTDDTKFIEEFSRNFSKLPDSSLIKALVFYHEALHAYFEENKTIFGELRPVAGDNAIAEAEHKKINAMVFSIIAKLVGERELTEILEEAEGRISVVGPSDDLRNIENEEALKIVAILQGKGIISGIDENELNFWARLLMNDLKGVYNTR